MSTQKIVQWREYNGVDYDYLYPVVKDGYITYSMLNENFTLPWSKITGTNPLRPAGQIILTTACYGTVLPDTPTEGRLFFKKVQ